MPLANGTGRVAHRYPGEQGNGDRDASLAGRVVTDGKDEKKALGRLERVRPPVLVRPSRARLRPAVTHYLRELGRSWRRRDRGATGTSVGLAGRRDRTAARWWRALGAGLVLLSLLAVFSSSPGWYVTDNRFEHFWSPARVLLRAGTLWDPGRGLGGVRGELAFAYEAVLSLLRGFGATPAVAERLWHVMLLTGAGLGMAALLSSFRPTFGPEHLVAGLFYAFNPYSVTFLIPSGLFLHYAVAPWLLVAFVVGVRGERPWRWAAVFALLVWLSGTLDPPGLAYSLLLFVPTGLYLVAVERTRRWVDVITWLARAALLAATVSAGVVVQLVTGSAALAARLFGTESVEVVHRTSSWAESWRGLGFWPSYYPEGEGLLREQHAGYLVNPALILVTFLPAVIALIVLGRSRWRPRLLFGGLALTGMVFMVGPHPPDDPSPMGRLLLEVYQRVPALTAMRTGYKAGAGLAIGLAGLVGLAATRLQGRSTPTKSTITGLRVAGCVALVGVISLPLWTGAAYSRDDRMQRLPEYWREALAWIDRQPASTRALVLPGTSNSRYRWGSPGDDIFDALLARPHIVYAAFPETTPRAFDLERALDGYLGSGRYRPGTLAPVARRLGIEYVVVRNDLDWQAIDKPRPSVFQALRDDPDLELVATFGGRGENVVSPLDRSRSAVAESRLAPVEVFRLEGVAGTARIVPPEPPLLLAGDGDAWPAMAGEGLLDDGRPVRYTADTSASELAGLLSEGAPLVVTDTNRRQVTALTRFGGVQSHTLAPTEDIGRAPTNLFDGPGSESVARFEDAELITSASIASGPTGYEPWSRPANAFDGDRDTSWTTGALEDPVGRSVKVVFDEAVTIGEVGLVAARPDGGGRALTVVNLLFSDGTTVMADLAAGDTRTRFPPRRTRSLEVRIGAVGGSGGGAVGLSEVIVPSLDLAEVIQVPDDVFRAAETDPALAEVLAEAPIRYLFDRLTGQRDTDVETTVRRRFRTAGTRAYRVQGRLAIGADTPDEVVDALAGDAVGAFGTSRFGGMLEHRGGLAVDGRPQTGWVAPAEGAPKLTVRFPPATVGRVEVTSAAGPGRSPVTAVRITAAGAVADLAMVATECGGGEVAAQACSSGTVTFPGVTTDRLTVEAIGVEQQPLAGGRGLAPLEISEVAIGPGGWSGRSEGPGGCASGVLSIDERDVGVRRLGSLDDLLAGRPTDVEGCDVIGLEPGWHRLDAGSSTVVDHVSLAAGDQAAGLLAEGSLPALRPAADGSSQIGLQVEVPEGGATLVAGQAYDKGWTAWIGERGLGPPVPIDTQAGWRLAEAGTYEVSLRYGPQRGYDRAMALSWSGVVLCLWLALRRTRG